MSNWSTWFRDARPALFVPGLILVSTLLAAAGLTLWDPKITKSLVGEGDLVEMATVWLYALGIIICLWLMVSKRWPAGWTGAAILGLIMIRELDAHKHFTAHNITSIRYWRAEDIALSEKVMVAMISLAIGLVVVAAVRKTWNPYCERLKRKEPHAIMVASMVALLVLSQIPDRTIDTGHLRGQMDIFLFAAEEMLEMAVALCSVIALTQWSCYLKRTQE